MAEIAAWIMLGLVAGSLARLLIPGEQKGGWLLSLVLGITGAYAGAWVGRQLGYGPPPDPGRWLPHPVALISATLGAAAVLAVWKLVRP